MRDTECTRGLAHDRHVGRVAPESGDVTSDPAQRLDLVKRTVITG